MSALKDLLRVGRLQAQLRPRCVLEETMLGMVRRGAFECGIKRLLSAVRLVEKTGRIKPLVRKANWLFVKVVSKFQSRSGRVPVKRALSTVLWGICSQKAARLWEGMEAMGMAIISTTSLLRVAESVILHRRLGGLLGFMGEKYRPSLQRHEVGLLAKRWLRLIDSETKVRGEPGLG